jgi:hypothetical protein
MFSQLCIVYIFWGEKVEQCLGEIYLRQKTIYSFGLFLRHVICTRPIYDLSQTNLDLDTFTTDASCALKYFFVYETT